jgi:hypothetical protein
MQERNPMAAGGGIATAIDRLTIHLIAYILAKTVAA